MQKLNSLEHESFVDRYRNDTVAISIDPRLAHKVLRSRLIPTEQKRAFLQSAHSSAADFIIEFAMQSELFYDIMLEVGVMRVQAAA